MNDDVCGEGKDYVVQIKIRNGPLLRAMRAAGFKTASSLARACGVSPSTIGQLLALKRAPKTETDQWRKAVQRLSDVLRVLPEDLFPAQHHRLALKQNTAEIELSVPDIAAILNWGGEANPEDGLINDEARRAFSDALLNLHAREHRILSLRYGMDGRGERTYEEIGKQFGLTKERIRQIEHRAIRFLRRPARLGPMIAAGCAERRSAL